MSELDPIRWPCLVRHPEPLRWVMCERGAGHTGAHRADWRDPTHWHRIEWLSADAVTSEPR